MNLLAFDTSTEFLSIAIARDAEVYRFDTLAGQSHSQLILPEIKKLLAHAGLQLNDLDGLIFGAGPGSFTGVRIAAGVAQGLAFGAQLPVLGVCTLMALAQASGANKVLACLDARMGEVYFAAYMQQGHAWQAVHAPGLYKPDAVPAVEGDGWVGVGSGWQAYGEILSACYATQIASIQPQQMPQASAMLQLAHDGFANANLTNDRALNAADAMPIYIRNRVALKTAEREQGQRL
ncbi:MAG: tRNA (adenosine(37)-N6)-threonylcarbamoyltransferase complex dimerization subunit type 1 TsaB, partial [Methylotenera sp.]